MTMFGYKDKPELLWKRYVVAVALLLVFIVSSHMMSIRSIGVGDYSSEINMSGRQRTLSQRILYFASDLVREEGDVSSRSKLIQDLTLFERSHDRLTKGGRDEAQVLLPPRLFDLYFGTQGANISLDQMVRDYVASAKLVLSRDRQSAIKSLADMERVGTGVLLDRLDSAVLAFETESKTSLEFSRSVSSVTFLLALLILGLEVLFIFYPAHVSIVGSVTQLKNKVRELRLSEEQARDAEARAKRNEQKSLQAQAKAVEAAQARHLFLNSMSHELRTPLNAIIGFSDIALTTGGPAKLHSDLEPHIQQVNESGRVMLGLVSDLLDMTTALGDDFDVHRISLSVLLTQLIQDFRSRAEGKGLTIVQDCDEDLIVFTDRNKLKRVLSNLLSNAVKFTYEGSISIVAELGRDDVRIHVRDTGIGIAHENFVAIFEQFKRLDDNIYTQSQGGVGIGLYLCQIIAQSMDANISLDSTLGEGSCFTLILPRKIDHRSQDGMTPDQKVDAASSPYSDAADMADQDLDEFEFI